MFRWYIYLSKKNATDLLKRFKMLNCKSTPTPMNVNEKLVVQDGTGMASAKCFRSLVGGLNYLSHTRSDLAFPVSVIFQIHASSKNASSWSCKESSSLYCRNN